MKRRAAWLAEQRLEAQQSLAWAANNRMEAKYLHAETARAYFPGRTMIFL
jgi:hypothetical protein